MRNEMGKECPSIADGALPLRFPVGMPGFEGIEEYILRGHKGTPVWELCPADGSCSKFVLFAAESIVTDYCPEISKETLSCLKAESKNALSYFVIAVVPGDIARTTVNLRSPVAVNFQAGLAAQVILDNTYYPMRYPIFSADGRVN